jgi:signal transduction histidine kinase
MIAVVRLALAAGALVVISIDPTQPSKHAAVAYTAFATYLLYSAVVFQLVRTRPRPWLPLTTQLVDLLWVPPVLYFTEGANTPFFPFFVVFTLTAGIRWGRWASWLVTAYSLVVYVCLLFVETPTPLDLNNDLMRLGYLLIVGTLGGYLTEYRRQREGELKTLHTISEAAATEHGVLTAMGSIVEMARAAGLAESVVGVLREPEEGDHVLVRGGGDTARLGPDEAAPFFAAAVRSPQRKGTRAIALTDADAVILRLAGADSGLVHPIRAGEDLVGAIFFLFATSRPHRQASDEFLSLLLRHVIPQLETLYVLEQTRQARILEERRRIARDLHDGFVQILAALGLRVDALGAAAAEPQRKELAQIREIIAREQKRVRDYIVEMREPVTGAGSFREVVGTSAEAFRARTQIPVAISLEPAVAHLPRDILRELAPLLREALTNVEKHARAARVAIAAGVENGRLVLTVRDDGIGIGGAPDAPTRGPDAAHGHGLSSMRERAELLGGTLTVRSAAGRGTILTVSIPLPALV